MYNKHKMYKVESIYAPRLSGLLRYAGLFIPIVLIGYGVLAQYDIINVRHTINPLALYVLAFCWLVLSLVQFALPIQSKRDNIARVVIYHILTAIYLIFIAGVSSPMTAVWVLLMIASFSYFSERGLQLSALTFSLVVGFDIYMWMPIDGDIYIYDLLSLSAILALGMIIMSATRTKDAVSEALERVEDEESLQRDQVLTIINNMSDGVFSTDGHGIIRIYNAASLELLDTNDGLIGRHVDAILPLTDKDGNTVSIYQAFQAAKSVIKRDDLIYAYKDGEKIRIEITYSPIRSSFKHNKAKADSDGYIVIMRDITKAKSLEEERDEFVSVISHELRTPITIAEGTISNVQVMMEHPNVTPKMLSDSIKMAHDQVLFLASMVNDLSALSRAERGVADEAEEIDVRELANKMLDKYTKPAKEKGLTLDLDLFPKLGKVKASRLYLEEMIQNFITNSIKYTKKGGITLDIKRSGSDIIFSIKDTGIGISKSDQTKIFRKFYRSEDYRTRETSGTGLGLYVSAKLAHKLGTTIQVTSRLDHGSTFSFSLPRLGD